MCSLNVISKIYISLFCVSLVYCESIQLYLNAGSPCPKGICRPLQRCSSAKELLTKGDLPIICSFEEISKQPVVCCQNAEQIKRKTPYEETCEEYATIYVIRIGAIVGGNLAAPVQYPHMALIGYGDENDIQWNCGGSLISERYVLTAAHCSYAPDLGSPRFVKLGVWNIKEIGYSHQNFTIEEIIQHPDYKPPVRYHDIALIKLNKNVQFNSTDNRIRPACLNHNKTISNRYVTATGWGSTSYGGDLSDVLMQVRLDIFSQQQCNKSYGNKIDHRTLPNGILEDIQICAGSFTEEKDACQGDSGGPIQTNDFSVLENGITYILGITSFGKSCGLANVPGVYTRVSEYIPWIESIVWPQFTAS